MKIISLEINCFRGIKHFKQEFNQKNCLIYGDNGTGKSGIIDAIDFLLQGDISRLRGDGTQELSISKHGKYVTATMDESWVKAVVKLPNYSENIEIKRKLSDSSNLTCLPKYKKDFEEIQKISSIHAHYLSRREILQFISVTGQTRAKNIESILGINTLEKNRAILQKLKNTYKSKYELADKTINDLVSTINTLLNCKRDDWIEEINSIRSKIGAISLKELNAKDIVEGISMKDQSDILAKLTQNIECLEKLLNCIGDNEAGICHDILQCVDQLNKISLIEDFSDEIKHVILYEQGLQLIQDNIHTCPLCGQNIKNIEQFKIHLEEKIKGLKTCKQLNSRLEYLRKKIQDKISEINSCIERIDRFSVAKFADISLIDELKEDIDILLNGINDRTISDEVVNNFVKKSYKEKLNKSILLVLLKNKTEIDLDTKQIEYKKLVQVQEKLTKLEEEEKELKKTEEFYKKASILYGSYIAAQQKVLINVYESIRTRFEYFYIKLHSDDESNFSSVFDRQTSKLNLNVKFKDGNLYPPNAVHSEGHQDSMGICLFLALSEKIASNKLAVILLDDVVMSIDIDHRKKLCKLLNAEFPKKQLIITTHNYVWRKELQLENVVDGSNIFHFRSWDLEHGPYLERDNDVKVQINDHLTKGRKNEAIYLMRYHLEELMSMICSKFGLSVPYKSDGRWTLGEMLTPVENAYKKAIQNAVKVADKYKRSKEKIEEIKKRMDNARKELSVDKWAINPGTHFTEWAQDFSIDELKDLANKVENYCQSYFCPHCNRLIELEFDQNNDIKLIHCGCGEYNFSCKV